MFHVNQFVRVVGRRVGPRSEDGAIGIVCRGSDDTISRVFLIRGPYWRADDPHMMELHSHRSGVYVPTRSLEKADVQLTPGERSNLIEWWSAHGFDPELLA